METQEIITADQFIMYLSMLRTIRYKIDSKKFSNTVEKRSYEKKEIELMELLKRYNGESSILKTKENDNITTNNRKVLNSKIKRRKT